MIPIENGLSLIEQFNLNNEKGVGGKVFTIRRPEEDTSAVGQTLAILDYQRIYMKHVFSEENEEKHHHNAHPASKHSTTYFQSIHEQAKKPVKKVGIDKAEAIKSMSKNGEKYGYTAD